MKWISTLLCLLALSSCGMIDSHDTPAIEVPAQELQVVQRHVQQLCAHPRHGNTIEHARNYIEARFKAAGWQVSRQYFTTSTGETRCNICAVRPGKKDTRYIIGAHYDACDIGVDATGYNQGADDNASAVAVLLELAARLPQTQPEHTIELVAWDCEEPPYFNTPDMGSAHHAAACNSDKVLGLICLEMLGYYTDEPDSQPSIFPGYSLMLPTVGNFVAVVGDTDSRDLAKCLFDALKQDMPAARINIPFAHDTELYFSDHRNYYPYGIPSIMVTDTAMLRNGNYHELTDTPDTLDYHRMAIVVRGITRAVIALAYPAEEKR